MSSKTYVIERLFNERWNDVEKVLRNPLVTLTELKEAIDAHNVAHPTEKLSSLNPANFIKDFIRIRKSANRNWPTSVFERGYTAKQVTGDNQSFHFVSIAAGQTEPFPTDAFEPGPDTHRQQIESVSLPISSRRLGRNDEPWLVQVLVRLRVLETHFAIYSPNNIVQLDHLQMGVKLHKTEIDALFLAIADNSRDADENFEDRGSEPSPSFSEIIVTCEAKGLRDDILSSQVISQIQAAFKQSSITQDTAIAVAVKAIGPSEIYVVEFEAVKRADADALTTLTKASDAIYQFMPTIPGIGE